MVTVSGTMFVCGLLNCVWRGNFRIGGVVEVMPIPACFTVIRDRA